MDTRFFSLVVLLHTIWLCLTRISKISAQTWHLAAASTTAKLDIFWRENSSLCRTYYHFFIERRARKGFVQRSWVVFNKNPYSSLKSKKSHFEKKNQKATQTNNKDMSGHWLWDPAPKWIRRIRFSFLSHAHNFLRGGIPRISISPDGFAAGKKCCGKTLLASFRT